MRIIGLVAAEANQTKKTKIFISEGESFRERLKTDPKLKKRKRNAD